MNPKALKYILDIENVIDEIEQLLEQVDNDFKKYSSSFIYKRTLERDLEIIGEAINKLLKTDSTIVINQSRRIIGLRNLIIHSYDTIEDELIWGIVQKNIPQLKEELIELKSKY